MMIVVIALFVGFALGAALGATAIRDHLDDLWTWPSRPVRPTLPLTRVLTRVEERRLEIPTVRRRQRLPRVIDIV